MGELQQRQRQPLRDFEKHQLRQPLLKAAGLLGHLGGQGHGHVRVLADQSAQVVAAENQGLDVVHRLGVQPVAAAGRERRHAQHLALPMHAHGDLSGPASQAVQPDMAPGQGESGLGHVVAVVKQAAPAPLEGTGGTQDGGPGLGAQGVKKTGQHMGTVSAAEAGAKGERSHD